MSNTRQDGYYWVKPHCGDWTGDVWTTGIYHTNGGYWVLIGDDAERLDSDFAEINESRIPSPDEMLKAGL